MLLLEVARHLYREEEEQGKEASETSCFRRRIARSQADQGAITDLCFEAFAATKGDWTGMEVTRWLKLKPFMHKQT